MTDYIAIPLSLLPFIAVVPFWTEQIRASACYSEIMVERQDETVYASILDEQEAFQKVRIAEVQLGVALTAALLGATLMYLCLTLPVDPQMFMMPK